MRLSNSILFVLVLYNCKLEDSKSYQTLLKNDKKLSIFIYDNSPQSQRITLPNIIYVNNPSNPGLGVAYNTAAKYAKQNGFEWIFLLDQDTTFPKGILEEYEQSIVSYPDIYMFAPPMRIGVKKFMSPVRLIWKMGLLKSKVPHKEIISLHQYSPINSGLCISVNKFIEVGGYKPEVFLDYSDFQFIENFKKTSSLCYILNTEVVQDFSAFTEDSNKSLIRFQLFCKSIKACDKKNILDKLGFFIVVLKRSLSISIKKMTLKPLIILYQSYIKHV